MLSAPWGYVVVGVEQSCGGDVPNIPSAYLADVTFTSGSCKSPVKWVWPSGVGHTLYPLVLLEYEVNPEFHFFPAEISARVMGILLPFLP